MIQSIFWRMESMTMDASTREQAIAALEAQRPLPGDAVVDASLYALWIFRVETMHDLHLRIGINTGLVVVGPVGTTQERTVMGDPVNVH